MDASTEQSLERLSYYLLEIQYEYMKTLSEKINEALYASVFTVGSGTDEDDLLTREYGNLY